MRNRLEIGQAVAHVGNDACLMGNQLAVDAKAGLQCSSLQPRLALLFASTGAADPEMLAGIREGLGGALAPPLIGCTTPFPLTAAGPLPRPGAVLTLLSSREDYLTVKTGIGRNVFDDPDAAVSEAIESGEFAQLLRERRDGFFLLFTPGFKYNPDATTLGPHMDEQLVKKVAARLRHDYPMFGASSADDYERRCASQFAGYEVLHDCLVVAFVETALASNITSGYGLRPSGELFRIDELAGGVESGQYVTQIEGEPAEKWIDRWSQNRPNPMVFAVGDPIHGFHYARPLRNSPLPNTVFFLRDVPSHSVMRPVKEVQPEDLLAAAATVIEAACEDKSEIREPRLVLGMSCGGRAELFGGGLDGARNYAQAEVDKLREVLPPRAVFAGLYTFGEHCRSMQDREVSKNYAFAALVLANNLHSRAALLDKLRRLSEISYDLQFVHSERQLAERVLAILNEIGYAGGMICFADTDTAPKDKTSLQVKFAKNADEDPSFWETLLGSTVAFLNHEGEDLLGAVLNDPDKRRHVVEAGGFDLRWNRAERPPALPCAHVIFPLREHVAAKHALGTLHIGLNSDHPHDVTELAALQVFASMIGRSLASFQSASGVREEIQKIYALSRKATDGRQMDALLAGIIKAVIQTVPADYASVRLIDETRHALYFRAFHPNNSEAWPDDKRMATFPLDPKAYGDPQKVPHGITTITTKEPFRSREGSRPEEVYNGYFPKAVGDLTVPLLLGDRVIGVITVNHRDRHYTQEEEYQLATLARSVATALTFAEAQVQASILNSVSELFLRPILDRDPQGDFQHRLKDAAVLIQNALNCKVCSIFLVDPEISYRLVLRATTSPRLRSKTNVADYVVGEGFTGNVALHQKSLRISSHIDTEELKEHYPDFVAGGGWSRKHIDLDDALKGGLPLLAVPVMVKDTNQASPELVGVIRCVAPRGGRSFPESDQRLLESIAGWLGTGVKHAQTVQLDRLKWRQYSSYLLGHQLRMPLGSVDIRLANLQSRVPPELYKDVSECRAGLARMRRLVDALSLLNQTGDISRLLQLDVLLQSIVDRAISNAESAMQLEYPKRSFSEVVARIPKEDLKVKAFNVFLREALVNLITNALKVSPLTQSVVVELAAHTVDAPTPPGTVVIDDDGLRSIHRWGEAITVPQMNGLPGEIITLTVTDQGPGIASRRLPELFHAMVRDPGRPDDEGLGLGLAIVKSTAQAHAGVVAVRTELGKGASFSIVIPKVTA